tara:strand:+ start:1855 stop:2715 length:861 start_codon:yes stop_codon:yes gene_type:complete
MYKIKSDNSLLISSRRNPLVRRLKKIASEPGKNEYSMLLLEGTHLLEEALKTNFLPLEIIVTPSWKRKNFNILESISNHTKIIEVTESVLEAALSTVHPDGVASLYPLSGLPLIPKNANFVLALDRLQDPGNLGNLFRTALAADVELLWIASGVNPLNQKVIRSSVGAFLHLPFERLGSSEEIGIQLLIEKLEASVQLGYQVIASVAPSKDCQKNAVPYWEIDWNKPTVLVLGNEGSGIDTRIQNICTHLVTLPHNLLVESLNVAAVAVPLLLERRRAKMNVGIHP